MPGFKLLKTGSGFESTVWMSLSLLLLLGTLSTVIDLLHLSTKETQRANGTGQRAVIDAVTGVVSLSALNPKSTAFDVGDSDKKPEETHPPELTPEEPAAKSDEPKPEEAKSEGTEPSTPEKAPEGMTDLRTQPLPTALPEASGKDTLVQAPAPEVSEKKDDVMLPKRNGATAPAQVYARRFARTPDQHLLSLVILDAGLSAQSLPIIMGLPKDVTVAFSPYTEGTGVRVNSFRKAGYETWGMLPTMSMRYPQDDPGPLGLVATLPQDELLRRLHVIMANTIGSAGVVLPPDEALTAKTAAFSPIIAEIDGRGLNILATSAARTATQVSGTQKLQSTVHRADVILDPVPDEVEIQKKLAEVVELLKTKDTVVVAASARPQTLLLLQKWFHDHPLESPNVLAPLSAQWQPKEAPEPAEKDEKAGEKKEEKKDDKAEAEKKPDEKKSDEKKPEAEKKDEKH